MQMIGRKNVDAPNITFKTHRKLRNQPQLIKKNSLNFTTVLLNFLDIFIKENVIEFNLYVRKTVFPSLTNISIS
jgi:hypothetical protein